MPSGRPRGGTNKYWTAKEKEKILLECKEKGIGGTKVAKEYGISKSQYFNWTKAYLEPVSYTHLTLPTIYSV